MTDGLLEILVDERAEPLVATKLDIVFVHGLGGDREGTWQSSPETFWPKWLAASFVDCRVYSFGYNSTKFASFFTGEGASLQDIASIFADAMLSRDHAAPAVLFVCHSLGGLVAKQVIRRCTESADSDYQELGRSVVGLAFLGTPHTGAGAASALDHLVSRFLSKQVKQLTHGADTLLELNDAFRTSASRQSLSVVSYYETEKTAGIHVVDKVSANPGVLGSEPVAVQSDHLNICKPASREAPVYKSICRLVKKLLKAQTRPRPFSPSGHQRAPSGARVEGGHEDADHQGLPPDLLNDFEYFTTVADDDRRDLEQKLSDAGRRYAIRDAKRMKERFNMALQRNIAQPAAVTRYIRLMSEVESRFKRHVPRAIAEGACAAAVDTIIQDDVITPCSGLATSPGEHTTAGLADGALYYLAGNCHLAWDNV